MTIFPVFINTYSILF